MKKSFIKMALILFILTVLVVPTDTQASTIRTDKLANVNEGETVVGNIYLAGGEPKVLGTVEGDVVVVGNNVDVLGNVNGDVYSMGGSLNIKGNVNGDVRVIGGSVLVEGPVLGDLVVIGSEIKILNNAKISGDLILIGTTVNIENDISTNLKVVSGATMISGKFSGTANITSEKINISKDSEVSGNLSYFSPTQAFVEDGAKVSGSVNFNKIDTIRENGLVQHAVVSFLNFWMLFRFVTTLILTFVLVYVFKIFSQSVASRSVNSFWKSILTGLASFIFVPIVVIILMLSLILFPVAMLIGMIYVGVFIISTSIAGMALGALMKKTFSKNKTLEISFQTATLGVIILTLLQFVPVVGDITRFLFVLAAFGSVWFYLYEKVRWGNVFQKN
jgi:cytoskeletal protein CcmA (bactofilin family)